MWLVHGKPSWKQIRTEFLRHFQNANAGAEWLHQLRNLKMEENLQGYADEFLTLLYKIGWDSTSDMAIYQFKMGLPRWMVGQLSTAEAQHMLSMELIGQQVPPLSVETLTRLALQVDTNNRIHTGKENKEQPNKEHQKIDNWKGGRNQANNVRRMECQRCGKMGHLAEKCLTLHPAKLYSGNNNGQANPFANSKTYTGAPSRVAQVTPQTAATGTQLVPKNYLRGERKMGECWTCGSKDHMANNCPKKVMRNSIGRTLEPNVNFSSTRKE